MTHQAQTTNPVLRIGGKVYYGQDQAKNLLTRSIASDRLAMPIFFEALKGWANSCLQKHLLLR